MGVARCAAAPISTLTSWSTWPRRAGACWPTPDRPAGRHLGLTSPGREVGATFRAPRRRGGLMSRLGQQCASGNRRSRCSRLAISSPSTTEPWCASPYFAAGDRRRCRRSCRAFLQVHRQWDDIDRRSPICGRGRERVPVATTGRAVERRHVERPPRRCRHPRSTSSSTPCCSPTAWPPRAVVVLAAHEDLSEAAMRRRSDAGWGPSSRCCTGRWPGCEKWWSRDDRRPPRDALPRPGRLVRPSPGAWAQVTSELRWPNRRRRLVSPCWKRPSPGRR